MKAKWIIWTLVLCSGSPGGSGAVEGSGNPSVLSPGAAGALEEIETEGGRLYRGRVEGYDVETRCYILRGDDGQTVAVPENIILTIRSAIPEPAGEASPVPPVTSVPPSPTGPVERSPVVPVETPRPGPGSALARVLAALEDLPTPALEAARKALADGLARVLEKKLREALPYLERALELDPGCVRAELLIGAIYLEQGRPSRAQVTLRRASSRHPKSVRLLEMLATTAEELGYLELAARRGEEAIRLEFAGAEREYRLFQFRRQRDPVGALEAWKAYLGADPGLQRVRSPEAELFHLGQEAIARGDAAGGLARLAAAARTNPFMKEFLRPYRVEALDLLLRARQRERDPEGLQTVLEALVEEAPERSEELRARLDELAARERGSPESAPRLPESVLTGPEPATRLPESVLRVPEPAAPVSPPVPPLPESSPQVVAPAAVVAPTPVEAGKSEAATSLPGESASGAPSGVEDEPGKTAPAFAEKAAPPAASATEYFPLRPGSWWVYRHGDGTRNRQSLARIDVGSGYGSIYRFENAIEFESSRFTYGKSCFLNRGLLYEGQGSDASLAEPILATPVETGKRWSWRKGTRGEILCERQYEATDAEVHCRAGTFSGCLKVRATFRYRAESEPEEESTPILRWFYYARNVGLVKVESENPLDGKELEDYSIASETP